MIWVWFVILFGSSDASTHDDDAIMDNIAVIDYDLILYTDHYLNEMNHSKEQHSQLLVEAEEVDRRIKQMLEQNQGDLDQQTMKKIMVDYMVLQRLLTQMQGEQDKMKSYIRQLDSAIENYADEKKNERKS